MKNFYKIVLLLFLIMVPQIVHCKTITFAVASDINYSASEQDKTSDGVKALKGFVDRVNESEYDFVVFAGDNISKSNAQNIIGFLNEIKRISVPYYLVMGNQDVHKISGLSKSNYLKIISEENKYQKNCESSYYFYPTKEIMLIVLDGVSSGMPSNHGVFTANTLKWLDSILLKNMNKKVIVFQHVPYVEPYEKKGYSMLNKQDYYATIKRHKNIMMIVAGHYGQAYTMTDENGVLHLITPSLNKPPYYYYELKINYDKKLFSEPKNFEVDGVIKQAI